MVMSLGPALVLVVHSLIHLTGSVVPWRLATFEGHAYTTSALGGAVDVGGAGTKLVGLAWLAVAIGLVAAAGRWRPARPGECR